GSNGTLYLRDMTRGETIAIDAPQGGSGAGVQSRYMTANSDDSRIFFTNASKLTADSTARGGAEDLYEFEVTSDPGEPLRGKLTDLTIDDNPGESAGVQNVIGASEDGSAVYFVAEGVLGDGAAHGAERK